MDEPKPIKKLNKVDINRIAAGEVIQRPANALKEMIENSIDAKATNIQIILKEGGLKYLQIIDNGIGIRREDFQIICERFTTSKLEKFEDLHSINTYGFRGEALASISHVAHLTIQSKTANSDCAYKASFIDSKLKDSPKPCAGNQGTIITVEDLFYNMTSRKTALKHSGEEFRKISDVVNKYAVHNASIGFGLKKFGENNSVKTSSDSSTIDNIKIIYGNGIARELIEIKFKDDSLKFQLQGYITNVNYSTKKSIFILFINNRLVDSTSIKKGVEHIYSTYLPKNTHPFVFLSLEIDPQNVDVNVHPTKHEVHFLHEDQIVEKICGYLESKLLGSNNSRVFYTQAKLPCASENLELSDDKNKQEISRDDKNLVRTESDCQKLDKFMHVVEDEEDRDKSQIILDISFSQTTPVSRVETRLMSILSLRDEVEKNCHKMLRKLLAEHVFVGCIDPKRCLIQYETKLYLCRTDLMVEHLFYEIILYNFSNFGTIDLSNPLSLKDLAMLSLDSPEAGWTPEEEPKEELAKRVVEILQDKAEMLDEYFSLKIDKENGLLINLPLLMEKHLPDMGGLPLYLLRLATEVDWTQEKECFRSFAQETAHYYSKSGDNWYWNAEHVLYPAIKKYLLPPKEFADNAAILQLANLPDLYKVFERC